MSVGTILNKCGTKVAIMGNNDVLVVILLAFSNCITVCYLHRNFFQLLMVMSQLEPQYGRQLTLP